MNKGRIEKKEKMFYESKLLQEDAINSQCTFKPEINSKKVKNQPVIYERTKLWNDEKNEK